MGHWGDGFLENDEAVDWLCKLQNFIKDTIEGNGPRGSRDEPALDEKITAIYVATTLEFKPNFNEKLGTCPLGWKFPNDRIMDSCLESIKEMRKHIKKDKTHAGYYINQLDILQDRVKVIKQKLTLNSF